ncbi:uncharacterized protein VTP21DRAFT_2946 [Calcarisporiella thermophila]|uniref:uncharacterized protein n=1 Tax=Calcarisporiella thermophila TaxID=911321 RepID=UPI003743D17C
MPLLAQSQKYPAKKHCQKVAAQLGEKKGFFYLRGEVTRCRHDTDLELPFRQESNFQYLTGINKPGFHLLYDLAADKLTIIVPDVHEDEIVWCGAPPSIDELKSQYEADDMVYEAQLPALLDSAQPEVIHTLPFTDVSALSNHRMAINTDSLVHASQEARLTKDEHEIELMRFVNHVSSDAHVALMRAVRNGKSENDLDALFRYECARKGAKFPAYNPIVGCGENTAVLHYVDNSAPLGDGQMLLVDAGGEYQCYAADITRTYPVNGKFTEEQRIIYETVLEMQQAVIDAIKPGVAWEDMHRLALRVCCRRLKEAGLLVGSEEELLANFIPNLFFVHGLGHSIGLDVHDSIKASYPPGVERINEPGIRYLRMRRNLEEGMVVTVEPGVYFCEHIIRPALNDERRRFINLEQLERFRPVGGVRIEDCVVVRATGVDNLTTAPKTVKDIEAVMAQ